MKHNETELNNQIHDRESAEYAREMLYNFTRYVELTIGLFNNMIGIALGVGAIFFFTIPRQYYSAAMCTIFILITIMMTIAFNSVLKRCRKIYGHLISIDHIKRRK